MHDKSWWLIQFATVSWGILLDRFISQYNTVPAADPLLLIEEGTFCINRKLEKTNIKTMDAFTDTFVIYFAWW